MRHGTVVAVGLMSGTSLDGIDAAVIVTDGDRIDRLGPARTVAYDPPFRDRLRHYLGRSSAPAELVQALTVRHADVVRHLTGDHAAVSTPMALVGFHGQTILHDPVNRVTRQIGDGALLANLLRCTVVADFRSADMAAGGQAAPLAPIYHRALCDYSALPRPVAVLNVGGVANVTWIGADAMALLAFDTGPGNALLDDWVLRHTGRAFDTDGCLAAAGQVDTEALARLLAHPYFRAPAPKSLDRNAFDPAPVAGLSVADGAATLTAFTACSVALGLQHMPVPPKRWLVTGGGRRNPTMMRALAERLATPVEAVEAVGWDGDALEAQAFGFLAVRHCRGLPLTFPGTTGVVQPVLGGQRHQPVRPVPCHRAIEYPI